MNILSSLESGLAFIIMLYIFLASFLGLIFIIIFKNTSKPLNHKLIFLPFWLLLESLRFILHLIGFLLHFPFSIFKRLPYRLRQLLFILSFLSFLTLATQTIFKPKSTEAAWFDDYYAYRTACPVAYSGSTSLTEYQVMTGELDAATLITHGKMRSDHDDIHFTNQKENS